MSAALLQILPLAFAAIAPTMVGLIVLFLSEERGLVKAFAFILGKYLLYILWGLVALRLAGQVSGQKFGKSTMLPGFFLIFGALLLILTVRSFFGDDDPDAPPPRLFKVLEKLGPVKLFGMGIVLSLLQPRFLLLVLTGAAVIAEATLSTVENILFLLLLALLMIWPMLIPVIIFLRMDDYRDATMKSIRVWLIDNQRKINGVVMGVFGVLLLILGLTGLF